VTTLGQVAEQMYRFIDTDNFMAMARLFTEDCVYERGGIDPIRGRAGLLSFYTESRRVRYGVHTIVKLLEDGIFLAAEGTFDATLMSGDVVRRWFMDVFEFDGMLISRRKTYRFMLGE